jgi:hypothetical protein
VLRNISDNTRDTAGTVVATSDSAILDGCRAWVDLAFAVIREACGPPRIVDLGRER